MGKCMTCGGDPFVKSNTTQNCLCRYCWMQHAIKTKGMTQAHVDAIMWNEEEDETKAWKERLERMKDETKKIHEDVSN